MYIELIHLEKMIIDGKDICLGITSDQLIEILGKPECIYENYGRKSWRHYYFDSELAFDYNLEGKLEFIELLCGHYGKLKPFIYGVSTFDVALAELVALLSCLFSGKMLEVLLKSTDVTSVNTNLFFIIICDTDSHSMSEFFGIFLSRFRQDKKRENKRTCDRIKNSRFQKKLAVFLHMTV